MTDHKLNLDTFTKSLENMIAISEANSNYVDTWRSYFSERTHTYSKDEVEQIIANGNIDEQIALSRHFFNVDGLYRRIVLHYATLLKYQTLLIPNPSRGSSLSDKKITKKYYDAVNFVAEMNLPEKAGGWALKALRDGAYYGLAMITEDGQFLMVDLPARYCRCRYRDLEGNLIVEFNVAYFDSLMSEKAKKVALNTYPPLITLYYKRWKKGKELDSWIILPDDMGVCFRFFDGLMFAPLFLDTIPASLQYDKSVDAEQERAAEEIRKIIVQKIPHLSDGGLLFEPEEAEHMHKGAVGMLKGNKNLSVLTTYADVEGIVSRTSNDAAASSLEKMIQNVYYKSGVSSQVFGSNSNLALKISLQNDKALMMMLVNKFNIFIEKIINKIYRDKSVRFSFQFLPVSWYDDEDIANAWFKMATSGYSFIMPALALGVNQADFANLKVLENDVLKLRDLMVPLKSAYTDSSDGGAPSKNPEDKSDQTIANEKSLDTGGSN